jgi:hypothetical protein
MPQAISTSSLRSLRQPADYSSFDPVRQAVGGWQRAEDRLTRAAADRLIRSMVLKHRTAG